MISNDIESNENRSLSIILKEEQIADIIINFLGKKEKLKYEEEKQFILRINDIEQFYYLLDEKIKKEQYTNIKLFTVSFLFNDKTSRVINTIESLNKYLETRDVIPDVVTLVWHIIIQFPAVSTVETQKIELTFNTKSDIGSVLLNIEHTNQSWGIEVLNLIKDKVLSVSIDKPKYVKNAQRFKEWFEFRNISIVILMSMLLITFMSIAGLIPSDDKYLTIITSYNESKISKDEFDNYMIIVKNIDKENIIDTLNKYTSNTKTRSIVINDINKEISLSNRYRVKILIGLVSFSAILYLMYLYLNKYIKYHTQKSFILTTNRVISSFKDYTNIKKKIEFYSVSLVIFTVITGLIINLIWKFIILPP